MFARILEFTPKLEKRDEFIKTIRHEILPIMKKQPGFLEMVPLESETVPEKAIALTLWTDKREAEKYARETFSKVEQILKPYVKSPLVVTAYKVETAVCEHLVEALTAKV